jgi:hypothetical protein
MKEITKIGVWPASKVMGIIMAVLGFIITLFGVILVKFLDAEAAATITGASAAVALLMGIVQFGIAGFILGGLFAWLYNKTVKYTKGFEIELK